MAASEMRDDAAYWPAIERFESAATTGLSMLPKAENVAVQYERRINHDGTSHRPVVDQAPIEPAAEIPEGHGKEIGENHDIKPDLFGTKAFS